MSQQQPGSQDPITREHAVKIILTIGFGAVVVVFAVISGPDRLSESIRSWGGLDFVLLSLATLRLGHLVAYDRVMEPFRSPFARTVPDGTGAGESVEAKGVGARQAIGQLITCPICAGTWIAAGLVYALVWLPGVTRLFLWMTAAVGLAEVINSMGEAWCWNGQLARTRTGEILRRMPGQDDSAEPKQNP